MANGVYGLTIPVNINPNNIDSLVDIYYNYRKTMSYDDANKATFKKLSSTLLSQAKRNKDGNDADEVLEGMYTLQLPVSEFSEKGFYTVYIKPKEVECNITDIGVLQAFPDVRGIVIDTNNIDNSVVKMAAQTNNGLAGYRIVYISESGERQNYHRVITSNNRCEPIIQAPNSSSDKAYSYRYNESSTISFLTVTPSGAPSFKSNVTPYIGKPTQKILLVNTLFEPIMINIELTEHDADTISTMLEGSQLRSLDGGLVTTFNDNNEIYHQSEHFSLKDSATGNPVYEVKEKRNNNIDFTQSLTDKI